MYVGGKLLLVVLINFPWALFCDDYYYTFVALPFLSLPSRLRHPLHSLPQSHHCIVISITSLMLSSLSSCSQLYEEPLRCISLWVAVNSLDVTMKMEKKTDLFLILENKWMKMDNSHQLLVLPSLLAFFHSSLNCLSLSLSQSFLFVLFLF